MTTFINLVKKHYVDEFGQKIDVLNFVAFLENYVDGSNMDDLNVSGLLPNLTLVTANDKFNVVHHGEECDAEVTRLYRWNDYYIIYSFEGRGDDLEVLDMVKQYGTLKNFFRKCFTVYHQSKFKNSIFLDSNVTDVNVLIQFFKNTDPENGLVNLINYVTEKYNDS